MYIVLDWCVSLFLYFLKHAITVMIKKELKCDVLYNEISLKLWIIINSKLVLEEWLIKSIVFLKKYPSNQLVPINLVK